MDRQDVVEISATPAGQRADGFHFLRLTELRLHLGFGASRRA